VNGDPEQEGGAPDDEEAVDGGEGAADGEAAPAPRFGPNQHALGDQKFIVSDTEIKQIFGTGTYDSLSSGRSRWAARFSGAGLDGPSADPIKTAALIRRLAIAARWMANGLFPGHGAVPGFVLGEATHSIVLEFALAPEEEPVRVVVGGAEEDRNGEARERRTVYPTVEGGRYLGTLLASADESEKLIERFGIVGKQAVRTYQGALEEFVEFDTELDLLVPVAVEGDETDLRRVNMPIKNTQKELNVLSRKPREMSVSTEVEGLLYAQNSLNLGFGIQKDNESHITGEYDLRVADKLGPAWNKRVWAQIEEIGPKEDWMPRAGRTRRVLQDVVVLREGETRLGANQKKSRSAA
jgi:hypothetical protein